MKVYEGAFRDKLPIRLPVIVRVDGRAFHTYTRGLERPSDPGLDEVMNQTAIKLCEEIDGAEFAYVQSDEISVFIHSYKKLARRPWFGNHIQKMCSVAAGVASATFTAHSYKIWERDDTEVLDVRPGIRPAVFDARVFVLPEHEVCNYFIWRQQDAIRNSVHSLARSLYSQKELQNKDRSQLKELCKQAGRPWEEEPTSFRNGRAAIQLEREINTKDEYGLNATAYRREWAMDEDTPNFVEDRDYVEQHLKVLET